MSGESLISVIIPTYNAESTIQETIETVLSQTYRNLEVIVVDDGSTDLTCEVLENLYGDNHRVLIIRAKHEGVSHARNEGLKAAHGEFIAFCDADDVMPSRALETLERHALGIDIIAGGMLFEPIGRKDTTALTLRQVCPVTVTFSGGDEENFNRLWDANYLQSCCSKLFSTKFIRCHNLKFDESLSSYEDFDFVIRCLMAGARYSAIPDVCYHYLICPVGTGHSRFKPDLNDQLQRVAEHVVAFYRDVLDAAESVSCYERVVQLLIVAVNNAMKAPWGKPSKRQMVVNVFRRPIFLHAASKATRFPNKYSRLVVYFGMHGCFGAVALLAACRNKVRSVRAIG